MSETEPPEEEPDEPEEMEAEEVDVEEVEEPEPEPEQEDEGEEADVPDEKVGCKACGTLEADMLVVYDRNMDKPWKGGNPYSRICPECGNRTFAPKSLWETQEQKYVMRRGENTPVPLYYCPYEDCGEPFAEEPDECPNCERELIWEE